MPYQLEVEDSINHMSYPTLLKVIDSIPLLKIRKWKDEDVQFLFKIMYWSGLRPMEAIKLCKEDFHLRTRTIDLHATKTKKIDYGMFPQHFGPELAEWLNRKEDGRLFADLKYITFYFWIRRLGKMHGIKAWNTPKSESHEMTKGHLMRKSIGKNLLAGVHVAPDGSEYTIFDVSPLLRHKDITVTANHYLKTSLDAVKKKY